MGTQAEYSNFYMLLSLFRQETVGFNDLKLVGSWRVGRHRATTQEMRRHLEPAHAMRGWRWSPARTSHQGRGDRAMSLVVHFHMVFWPNTPDQGHGLRTRNQAPLQAPSSETGYDRGLDFLLAQPPTAPNVTEQGSAGSTWIASRPPCQLAPFSLIPITLTQPNKDNNIFSKLSC